jgi:adenosylmethionine-8-amino-7-oxononanoate aminotransferase
MILRGEGIVYFGKAGQRILDGFSGLFTCSCWLWPHKNRTGCLRTVDDP